MKISQEMLRGRNMQPVQNVKEGKQNFEQMVLSESERMKKQEIEKLVQDITKQGEKLAKFRSFRDLAKFKRMIKQFLQETVYNGLELDEERSFNTSSFSHKLTTVRQVDEKLVELTEDIMDQEKKTVDLLGLIGEIQGLLINLYT